MEDNSLWQPEEQNLQMSLRTCQTAKIKILQGLILVRMWGTGSQQPSQWEGKMVQPIRIECGHFIKTCTEGREDKGTKGGKYNQSAFYACLKYSDKSIILCN